MNFNSIKPVIINQTERQSTSQSKLTTIGSKFHKQTNSMPKLPTNSNGNFNNYGTMNDIEKNLLSSLNSINSNREISPWQKKTFTENKTLTSAKNNSSKMSGKLENYYKNNDFAKIKKKVLNLVNESTQKKTHKKNLLSSESNSHLRYNSNTNTVNLTNMNAYNNSTTILAKGEPLSSRVYEKNNSIRAKMHKDLFEKESKVENNAKKQLVENTKVFIFINIDTT